MTDEQKVQKRKEMMDLAIAKASTEITDHNERLLSPHLQDLCARIFDEIEPSIAGSLMNEDKRLQDLMGDEYAPMSFGKQALVISGIAQLLCVVAKNFQDFAIEEEMAENQGRIA